MKIRNVLIFAADALREDYLHDSLVEVGEYIPTVAASTNSPAGFSSIVSGLYPSQHQTHAFTHRLEPEFNYLNAVSDRYDTRFYQAYPTTLSDVLGIEQDTENPISDVSEPFIILERDMTTHAPYNHKDYDDVNLDEYKPKGKTQRLLNRLSPGGGHPYFGGKNVDWSRIKSDYQSASETVAERFHRRLEELEKEGYLENTLVIFTSDHGELLGEYSEMSHGEPLVPELTRVPTVIRTPSEQSVNVDCMSHTDILPTIIDWLDEQAPWTLPGKSVYSSEIQPFAISERQSKPHTLEEFSFQNFYDYHVRSVWDSAGGYAFNKTSIPGTFVHTFRQAPLFNPLRGRDSLRAFQALYHHIKPTRRFGNPDFDMNEATEYLDKIDNLSINLTQNSENISEEAKEELRYLGYL